MKGVKVSSSFVSTHEADNRAICSSARLLFKHLLKFGSALLFLFILTLILSACSQMPVYTRPSVEMPERWRNEVRASKEASEALWWQQFGDAGLDALIEEGMRNNYDLLIASARVQEFIGRYGATKGALYPQVTSVGTAGRGRSNIMGESVISNAYQINLNASWEIDLWGRLRSAEEAARAQIMSAEAAQEALLLTTVSSIAETYINILNLHEQLRISKETADSRRDYYEIFKLRFEGGVISELELNQARSEYESALISIPTLERQTEQQENALSILIGRNPQPITFKKTLDDLRQPPIIAGLPSELLHRRPDIRQAEEDLKAANAQIGVARAAFFPTISLTGQFGWASAELSDLFTGPNKTWQWAGSFAAPIFKGGSLSGNLMAAEAQQRQALLKYQQTIQRAFREVEDALIEHKKTEQQLEIQNRQIASLRDYAKIARLRYENGYTSYIEVLDADRNLFNAELSLAQTKTLLLKSVIALYKAIGGQWTKFFVPESADRRL